MLPLLNDEIHPDPFLPQDEQSPVSVAVREFLVLVRKIHLLEETGLKKCVLVTGAKTSPLKSFGSFVALTENHPTLMMPLNAEQSAN